jgi:hypothetical protein
MTDPATYHKQKDILLIGKHNVLAPNQEKRC